MNNKLLSLLGLAKRAGRITLGHDVVVDSINKGKSTLILFTKDCSEKSLKDIRLLCEKSNIPIKQTNLTKDDVRQFFNREYGIISINDKGFSKKALSLLEENKPHQREEFTI